MKIPRIIIANPTLVTSNNPGQEGCIVGGDMAKFLTDVDTPRNHEIVSGQAHGYKQEDV
jgi:hypothetical protein